jgi:hypothetical protein
MLEVTSSDKEVEMGINFAEVYRSSKLYRYFLFCEVLNLKRICWIANNCKKRKTIFVVNCYTCAGYLSRNLCDICYRRNKATIEELSTPYPGSKSLYFPSKYSRSFFTQCMACLWKQHWSYWRNPLYNSIRFIFTVAVALLLGSMYWKVSSKM